jgi:hypothetical protein
MTQSVTQHDHSLQKLARLESCGLDWTAIVLSITQADYVTWRYQDTQAWKTSQSVMEQRLPGNSALRCVARSREARCIAGADHLV